MFGDSNKHFSVRKKNYFNIELGPEEQYQWREPREQLAMLARSLYFITLGHTRCCGLSVPGYEDTQRQWGERNLPKRLLEVENSGVLVCFSDAGIDHWPKTTWKKNALFSLQVLVHHQRKPKQELRAEAWWQIHRETLFTGLITTKSSAQGWHSPQCMEISHISHQSSEWPTDMPTGQANEGYFSIEVPYFLVTLVCVKLTKLTSTAGEMLQKVVCRPSLWRKTL